MSVANENDFTNFSAKNMKYYEKLINLRSSSSSVIFFLSIIFPVEIDKRQKNKILVLNIILTLHSCKKFIFL